MQRSSRDDPTSQGARHPTTHNHLSHRPAQPYISPHRKVSSPVQSPQGCTWGYGKPFPLESWLGHGLTGSCKGPPTSTLSRPRTRGRDGRREIDRPKEQLRGVPTCLKKSGLDFPQGKRAPTLGAEGCIGWMPSFPACVLHCARSASPLDSPPGIHRTEWRLDLSWRRIPELRVAKCTSRTVCFIIAGAGAANSRS